MVCFSSYALITKQAAAEDVRFFGQKAFGSVGSRERERKKRHISNVPLQGTIYLVVAKLAAHAHRKLSAVVQKSFARRSFFYLCSMLHVPPIVRRPLAAAAATV